MELRAAPVGDSRDKVRQSYGDSSRRWSRLRRPPALAVHTLGLLLALSVMVALGRPGASISSDEGAGIHQAVLLQRGGWLIEPTLPELDPGLVQQPFLRADEGPKGRAPYAKHPAYPVLLEQAGRLWWPHGLLVVGVVGTWVAAVAAALLARALRAGATLPTLWLVGLASPLTVDAHMVLAHAPAAGTAAVTALASAVVLAPDAFGPRARHPWAAPLAILMAAAGAASTVALRGEGPLLVGGLVFGALAAGASLRRTISLAGVLVLAGVGTRVVEADVVRSVVGTAVTAPAAPVSEGSLILGRVQAFQASWLDLGYAGHPGEALLGIGSAALALAVVGARLRCRPVVAAGLAALGLGCTLGWLLHRPPGLVPGLIPVTPWLVAGILSLRRSDLRRGLSRFLVLGSASAAAAVLATQYSFGGGVEWGGRFYAVVLPVAAPLAVAALWPPGPRRWRAPGAPIVLAVVAASGVLAAGGLLAARAAHRTTAAMADRLAVAARSAPPGRPGDPDQRAVVVGPQRLWPQLLWPQVDGYRWVTNGTAGLPCAFHGLRAAGFDRLVVLGPSVDALVELAGAQGWQAADGASGGLIRVVEAGPALPAVAPTCPPGAGG